MYGGLECESGTPSDTVGCYFSYVVPDRVARASPFRIGSNKTTRAIFSRVTSSKVTRAGRVKECDSVHKHKKGEYHGSTCNGLWHPG